MKADYEASRDIETVYDIVDRFVQHLIDEEYSPSTVSNYAVVVKEYLRFLKIKIVSDDFYEAVELPSARYLFCSQG